MPKPDLEPQPIAYRDFLELVPEKFEWMDGYLFDSPYSHQERRRLLAILLVNEGLIRTVQLASRERWLEALKQVYGEQVVSPEPFRRWAMPFRMRSSGSEIWIGSITL